MQNILLSNHEAIHNSLRNNPTRKAYNIEALIAIMKYLITSAVCAAAIGVGLQYKVDYTPAETVDKQVLLMKRWGPGCWGEPEGLLEIFKDGRVNYVLGDKKKNLQLPEELRVELQNHVARNKLKITLYDCLRGKDPYDKHALMVPPIHPTLAHIDGKTVAIVNTPDYGRTMERIDKLLE
jgi:hypothetical protein